MFVALHMIENFITEEELFKLAFQNLRKRGWKSNEKTLDTPNGGKLYFYDSLQSYQSQFFLRDLSSTHISKSFYISFPNSQNTIVYTPSLNISDSDKMQDLFIVKKITDDIYKSSHDVISNRIYNIDNNGIRLII